MRMTNAYESPETPGSPSPRPTRSLPKLALQTLLVIGILALLAALLIPVRRTGVREAARRAQCSNNLKNIATALKEYESVYHCLPPAYTVDAAGKPLHSWRTLLLP